MAYFTQSRLIFLGRTFIINSCETRGFAVEGHSDQRGMALGPFELTYADRQSATTLFLALSSVPSVRGVEKMNFGIVILLMSSHEFFMKVLPLLCHGAMLCDK